jgi:hypothetical protein
LKALKPQSPNDINIIRITSSVPAGKHFADFCILKVGKRTFKNFKM